MVDIHILYRNRLSELQAILAEVIFEINREVACFPRPHEGVWRSKGEVLDKSPFLSLLSSKINLLPF